MKLKKLLKVFLPLLIITTMLSSCKIGNGIEYKTLDYENGIVLDDFTFSYSSFSMKKVGDTNMGLFVIYAGANKEGSRKAFTFTDMKLYQLESFSKPTETTFYNYDTDKMLEDKAQCVIGDSITYNLSYSVSTIQIAFDTTAGKYQTTYPCEIRLKINEYYIIISNIVI